MRSSFLRVLFAVLAIIFVLTLFIDRPSDHSGRPAANKAKCQVNLKQIGLAIQHYCDANAGQYPDSFQTLMLDGRVRPDDFICLETSDEASTAPTTQAQADDLAHQQHVSYIYVGGGLNSKTVSSRTIVVLEPLSNHGDGINVLFGDMHPEFFELPRAKRILAAATTRPVMLPP